MAERGEEIEEEDKRPYKHVDLHSRVILARIGHTLDYPLHRRNVSVDKVLSVMSGYSHAELLELERELLHGRRDIVRKAIAIILQAKKEQLPKAREGKRKSAGMLLHDNKLLETKEEDVGFFESMSAAVFGKKESDEEEEEKLITDEDAETLVDAFERVLDEGVLDEEQLIEFTNDLSAKAVKALVEVARPATFWQKFIQDVFGYDRRDSLGLHEDSATSLTAACVQLPKFRVIEVCEIVAQEQDEGAEVLKRLTGIMERVDLFVSNKAFTSEANLQIARGYLMLMLEMRTLSAQAVHIVVKDLPEDEIKIWLKDLYGKDAIDLKKDEGGGEG
jgi:hypothetical protein